MGAVIPRMRFCLFTYPLLSTMNGGKRGSALARCRVAAGAEYLRPGVLSKNWRYASPEGSRICHAEINS